MTRLRPSAGPPTGLFETLASLRVSRCVLPEVRSLLDAGIWLVGLDGRAGVRAEGRGPAACARVPAEWPGCVAEVEGASWIECRRGGRHFVANVRGSSGPFGRLMSDPVTRDAPLADAAGRLLALVAEEMGRYAEHRRALAAPALRGDLPEIIGVSAAIEEARAEVRRALGAPYPVLIEGETGTGKDLVAWCIHHHGARREGRYVVVNCAAMPETLLESTLFGHKRGAFTGAVRDEPGLLVAARGGTIFLDEVAELSAGAQAKLLRAIESGEVLPVGANRSEKTDARVIAATNADLETAVVERRFRADLLYRLRVLSLRLPSLRQRLEDVPLLASHVLRQVCERLGVLVVGFSEAALAALVASPWPGNVRELFHEIERAALRCEGARIDVHHLSARLQRLAEKQGPEVATGDDLLTRGRVVAGAWEREQLERALVQTGWNVAAAAAALGVSRRTLFNRIKLFGLKRPGLR